MDVHITKQAIIDVFDNTDVGFDLAVVDKIFNKLPTSVLQSLIEDEFYDNFCKSDYYEMESVVTGIKHRFLTLANMVRYCDSNNILHNRISVCNAIKKNRPSCGYYFRKIEKERRE